MADTAYRAAAVSALRIEPLGALTAIFDRRSMQTHLVISPMPEMLAAMRETPCTAAQLADRLAAEFDLGEAGDAIAVIAERLAELERLGLAART